MHKALDAQLAQRLDPLEEKRVRQHTELVGKIGGLEKLGRFVKREDGMALLEGKEDRVGYLVVQEGIMVDGAEHRTLKSGVEGL